MIFFINIHQHTSCLSFSFKCHDYKQGLSENYSIPAPQELTTATVSMRLNHFSIANEGIT